MMLAMVVLATATSAAAQIPQLPAPSQAEPILREIVAMQGFEERVAQYVLQHRVLERTVPPLQPTRDMRQVDMAVQALALRIRLARTDAQPGDLITPEAGMVFRRRIATCLTAGEWAAIIAENAEEAEEEEGLPAGQPPALRVNMTWPEAVLFGFVPPQLLAALPRLPEELQYRIIGNALVLWDHHANLIVDFLPDAFAALT